jgi:ketosteroid isomerase-like protein
MVKREPSHQEAVRRVVQRINELWLSRDYKQIGELIAESAVIAQPGSDQCIRGREAYVQSYRDYDQAATTQEFSPGEPQVDVIGDVAVAICPFRIVYDLQGKTYREKGNDILVLSRATGEWLVVWRTLQAQPAEEGAG